MLQNRGDVELGPPFLGDIELMRPALHEPVAVDGDGVGVCVCDRTSVVLALLGWNATRWARYMSRGRRHCGAQ